jgi:hypothetical protein
MHMLLLLLLLTPAATAALLSSTAGHGGVLCLGLQCTCSCCGADDLTKLG